MKKLSILYNNLHHPAHVLEFALDAAKKNGFEIEGVFVTDVETRPSYPFPNDLPLTSEQVTSETAEQESAELIEEYIAGFRDDCSKAGVSSSIVKTDLDHLFQLTRSTDVFLIDARYQQHTDKLAPFITRFHCPVLAVSESASKPDRVVFAFDGSEDSEYAIRKYNALFPENEAKAFHLLTVNKALELLEHRVFINDFLEKKYKDLSIHHLEGDASEVIIDFLRLYPENMLVVMGSFGRSAVSRMIRPSVATRVFHETSSTIFIAHKR